MVAAWPWAQQDPLRHPVQALLENARFQFAGSMLFDGIRVSPQSLPSTYLPTWFAISFPEFYAVGLAAGLVPAAAFLLRRGRRMPTVAVVLGLVVMACLPPALAVWRRAVMYDGMRHFLFVVPFVAVLAGRGFAAAVGDLAALRTSSRPLVAARAAIAAVAVGAGVLSLGLTVGDLRALHPYEYVYFNRLVAGGQAAASARFETDYWGLSYKEGLDWLRDNYHPAATGRIRVANCSIDFLTSYPIRRSPALSARFAPASAYGNPPARILLATTRYDCHRRGGTTLHVVERKGVPLMYVLEREAPPAPGPPPAYQPRT
jgi:hypothetical protein